MSDAPPARADSARRAVDALLVALALALRLYRAGAQSLWYDEGTSAALAGRSLADILVAAANDVHPPLYYLTLAAWTRILGDGVVAMRSLSALAGALTVAGLLAVGHRLLPERPRFVWLAGLLATCAPFLLWYGQEVRMYAMAAAIGAWLVWLAVVATAPRSAPPRTTPPRWTWPALLGLTLAALHTQYVAGAAAVLAANLVAAGGLLAWRRSSGSWPWRVAGLWAATQALALLLFLPWLATAWPTLSAWPAVGAEQGTAGMFAEALRTYALGIRPPAAALGLVAIPIALAALGAVLGLLHPPTRALTAVAIAWAASPPLLIALLSLRRATWKPKFVLVGAPGFELLLAIGILITAALIGRGARRLTFSVREGALERNAMLAAFATTALLLAALAWPRGLTLRANLFDPAHQRDDYRGAIAEIVHRAGPDDAVLLVAPTQVELFDYYAPEDLARYPLPLERPPEPEGIEQRMDEISVAHRDLYALLYAEREADPEGLIETYLDTYRAKAFDRWIGDVRLALWATCPHNRFELSKGHRMSHGWIAVFGDQIGLNSIMPPVSQARSGDVLCQEVTWIPTEAPDADVRVFWQLLDEQGRVAAQRQDLSPLNGRVSTSSWPDPFSRHSGPKFVDRMALALPRDLAPGLYQPILGLYETATGERLRVTVPQGASRLYPDAPFTFGSPPDHLRLPPLEIFAPDPE